MTLDEEHRGACHCGALRFVLRSALAVAALPARACACGFCRRHAAISTSDPAGELRFVADDPAQVIRYRFGTGSAEFLVCGRCGVYVGALMVDGDRWYAIANLNALEARAALDPQPTRFDYAGEDDAARRARRRARWTPAGPLASAAPA